jgi:hypothetical protein
VKVSLPSGHTAELRDTLLRGDMRDARKGIVVVIAPDGSRTSDGSFLDSITGRLITRMLVAWDLDPGVFPLPSSCQSEHLAQAVLDKLPDDDYAALEQAVGPWVERLLSRQQKAVFTHVTGVKVEPATDADAARLAEMDDWTREDGPDPKSGSAPTGISSSESPALTGQPMTDGTQPISS